MKKQFKMTKKINEILNKKEINGVDLEELIKAREQKEIKFIYFEEKLSRVKFLGLKI